MWFHSQLKDIVNNIEDHIYKDYYNDLVYLNVTRQNYMKLIELCDYLCVTNVDILIDKIVDLYDTNIDEDLSQWDVSNLKTSSYIFSEKHKKNKILYNSIQSWKNYNLDIGI